MAERLEDPCSFLVHNCRWQKYPIVYESYFF
jgi:hypothetical protein